MALATVMPARGAADVALGWAANVAIALLFFLQGARLSREAVLSGLAAPRLHLLIGLSTYALFPALALAVNGAGLAPPHLRTGLLFLACLPSTVQSSIAFVSIARGNIAAAVCSASLSNILAVVMTPLLLGLLLGTQGGGFSWSTLQAIVVQLLLPFVAGQLARPLIGGWVLRRRTMLSLVDRGSILLVVYGAFGHAVVQGLWTKVSALDLLWLAAVCGAWLAVTVVAMTWAARALKLDRAEEIVAVICGSQKSLATGAPMAGLLFTPAAAGLALLPVMLFHQMQLFLASAIAQRYARRQAP